MRATKKRKGTKINEILLCFLRFFVAEYFKANRQFCEAREV